MADTSLVFNILGRDKVGPVLAKVKAEVAAASDDQVKGIRGVESALEKARMETRRLGDEFKRTGDLDVWKAFKDSEKNLSVLQKMHKTLSGLGDDADGLAEKLGDGLFGKLSKIPPQAWMGLAAGATAVAPVIGGIVAAAVTTAIGGAALAGGIALAAKNPQVVKAFGDFSTSAMRGLTDASDVFVGPLVKAADRFKTAFGRDILPGIRDDFKALAPVVDRVANGVVGFATSAMPGLNAVIKASAPVLSALAGDLPRIGKAFGDMLADMSNSTSGAVTGIHLLTDAISGLLRLTGSTVGNASRELSAFTQVLHGDFIGALRDAADSAATFGPGFLNFLSRIPGGNAIRAIVEPLGLLSPALDKATGSVAQANAGIGGFHNTTIDAKVALGLLNGAVEKTGPTAMIAADDYGKLLQVVNSTTVTADTVAGAMTGKMFSAIMTLDQATLGFATSQTQLSDAIRTNGLQLDIHTAKGQGNREAILAAVNANMANYQANISAGMSAKDAAAAYDTNTGALERQLQKAHFTQGQIDGLIGKYRSVPDDVNTNIELHGLAEAIGGLDDTLRRINGLNGRVTNVYIRTIHEQLFRDPVGHFGPNGTGGPPTNRWGGVYTHAADGLLRDAQVYSAVSSGARYAFAEPATGGEAFIPKNGDRGRSLGILSQAASWYGATVGPAGGGRGGGRPAPRVNNYQVVVNASPGTSAHEVGAQVVAAIKSFEKVNGTSWRS